MIYMINTTEYYTNTHTQPPFVIKYFSRFPSLDESPPKKVTTA